MVYFGSLDDPEFAEYMKVASNGKLEAYNFYHTVNKDCSKQYNTTTPGVVIIRLFDEPQINI